MIFEELLFIWISAWLVIASFAMIIARNIMHSVLFLTLAFFSAACLWILLEAEFLAMTLILVYVGAIMVLFLFVVMMLDIDESEKKAKFTTYLPLGIMVAIVVVTEIVLIVIGDQFELSSPLLKSADYSNISELAYLLYTVYVYPFELAAVLLLIAIISAVTLVHRGKSRRLVQNIDAQIATSSKDRLRIIKNKDWVQND